MPQSGYTPIQLYRSSTPAAVPAAVDLQAGELALNTADERLYFKNASGVVKLLASNAGALGTVTSVDVSGGTTGLTFSGGPITSSGTITMSGTLDADNGGTGQSAYTIGDILYASGASALSRLAGAATGNALISGGVATAPSWGKIGLTTHVSGILPVGNGGSGTSTAFTQGSVLFAGPSGVYAQDNANLFWDDSNNTLGIGTSSPNAPLTVQGAGVMARFRSGSATDGRVEFAFNVTDIGFINAASATELNITARLGVDLSFSAGESAVARFLASNGNFGIGTASPSAKLDVVGTSEFNGDLSIPSGTATYGGVEIGYRVIPRTTDTTVNTAKRGYCMAISAGITIPNATFAAGDSFSIYNDSASAITITQGASLTLRQAGTTNTGNRTLAARGFATIWFNSSSEAIIEGPGIS